ncbi:MAG: ABC transporter permease [Afipia felis]|nr:ABC transporter permease [Afipia felis]
MISSIKIGPLAAAFVSIALAGALVAGLFLAVGVDVMSAVEVLWRSSTGSLRTFGEGLVRATPLLMISITLLPSLRAGLYNIGAPGQLGAGALAATVVALGLPHAPAWIVVPLCALAALVGGALLAVIPGYLKSAWRTNEIVTTLAMNFIVVAVLGYLLNGPLQSDFANLPQSPALPASSSLPLLFPGTRAHTGLLLALIFVPALLILDRSLIGYRLRLFSRNQALASRAGVSAKSYVIWLMAFGGAGAGLAGWMQVVAIDHRLYVSVANPIGYAGLFVALLGALHPVGCIIAAYFLGALLYGGAAMQVGAGVSPEIIQVFLGLVLFVYAARPSAKI